MPLHHTYCISPDSTKRSRVLFYTSLSTACLILIFPLPILLSYLFPISKPLWTPPFLVQTAGISILSWLLASIIDIYPSIRSLSPLEALGRRSLEIYLLAEILQEFAMHPGKRTGEGLWDKAVQGLVEIGMGRGTSCLVVSCIWSLMFTGIGVMLDRLGWRLRL